MSNYMKKWLKAAGIRAVKTVAQTAVATVGSTALLTEVNWGVVAYSRHKYGTAADITVPGVAPLSVARYAQTLLPDKGGVGLYKTFTHVDVRAGKSRWDQRSGKQVIVSGF